MLEKIRSLAPAMVLGAMLLGTAGLAAGEPQPPLAEPKAGDHAMEPQRLRAALQARLDRLAAQLQLESSQQGAWNAFTGSVMALAEPPSARPGSTADAAAIARWRADRAAELARKLGAVADATSHLQAALNARQDQVFNDAYRRFQHHGPHCGPHGDPGDHGRAREPAGDTRPD